MESPSVQAADFGRLLRRHRKRIGATQRQLADLSTISVRGIRDLEAGRVQHPRLDTVKLLADGLRLEGAVQDRFVMTATPPPGDVTDEPVAADRLAPPPVPMNSTIGRSAEVGFVLDRLTDGQRLTSITGLTGVGKTRLALEVANTMHHTADTDVWWMSMSADPDVGTDGGGVVQDCIRRDAVERARSAELLQTAQHHPHDINGLVDGRDTLMFLDAIEGPGVDQEWIGRLLGACPSLKIVGTVLEPIDLPGEWILPLEPLAVPAAAGDRDAEQFADVASVRLFVSRILQVRPSFRLKASDRPAVAAICRLLDGLPLALEHAAFLCLAESPGDIVQQLTDDPLALASLPAPVGLPRDMRRILKAGLNRLTVGQRDLLRKLSRLEGDWTIREAANRIGIAHGDVARTVHGLLRCGYLRCSETQLVPRFRVIGLVRHVAVD